MEGTAVTAETTEHVVNELPIPAEGFGLIALVVLMGLLFVTFSYRNLSSRH